MPKRGIDYCIDVMEFLERKGFAKECPTSEVLRAISLLVGMTQSVRARYKQNLEYLGFIKENVKSGTCALNYEEVHKLNV